MKIPAGARNPLLEAIKTVDLEALPSVLAERNLRGTP